ncbi:MAG: NlpC/P60 family protein [Alsobacter sp.]
MTDLVLPPGFDRRRTPARPDLAAAHLEGRIAAARFAEGRSARVREATAPLRRSPAGDAPLDSEALYGEPVTVFDTDAEGWAWVQAGLDDYVGYMPVDALAMGAPEPSHKVAVLRTYLFPGPSIKLTPAAVLSLGSRLEVLRREGSFAVTPDGYVFADHLAPIDAMQPDFVAVAEGFLGAPYHWGGRTSIGCDCSGLVQVSLQAAGVRAPRDSDMQEAELGAALPVRDDLGGLARGDLVFWKGHVGIMRDAETLLHATGRFMLTVNEPLAAARDRIVAAGAGPITGLRRLTAGQARP